MEKPYQININMDHECAKCGKKGACQNGLCLKCAGDRLNMAIGARTILKAKNEISGMLDNYHKKINEAYLNNEDLTVNFAVKLRPIGSKIQMDVGISFVESKIKAGESFVIDEKQMELPL